MPTLEGARPGDKINMTIRMYFGLTEIKIECLIHDKTFVFTSAFDAADGYNNAPGAEYTAPAQQALPPANPAAAGLGAPNPYALSDPSASQVSLQSGMPPVSTGYPPASYAGMTPGMAAAQAPGYPPTTQAGYPPASSVYGGAAGYQDYYPQYSQGYPPSSQQYYSGYPPSNSQGYPPQSGSSYYGQH